MEVANVQAEQDIILSSVNRWIEKFLSTVGIGDESGALVKLFVLLFLVCTTAYILQLVASKTLKFLLKRVTKSVNIPFLKYTISNKLPNRLALLVPYSFSRASIRYLFSDYRTLISPSIKIIDIAFVFVVIMTIIALIKSFADTLQEKPALKDKPMRSYIQVIQIILYLCGAVVIFSIVTGKSATTFFAAMGAASAVVMLMFKDSIMGFVSSIQLTSNEMVKIGDWITMKKYGADGNVEEISLNTVKVQNFDKTITTIPTYALISDSFQNWRGMQESGGRRIKKCLYIQQNTIRFVTDEELAKYKQVHFLKEFIDRKEKEYELLNKGVDKSLPVGVHRLTNNQIFMQYANEYLKSHPNIKNDFTLLVRQMQPTVNGMEVEIYAFTNTVVWAEYEAISTEVFNHIIGVVSFFDLKIFEITAGSDGYTVDYRNIDNK